MTIAPQTADLAAIQTAVEILRKGGLVAFPTETVYGLGADASNPEAVKKIFRAKKRPADHPLIVHIGRPEQLSDWAQDIPQAARELAAKFWPGPLAMVLRKQPNVPLAVTGGQQTVALRIPDNPVALSLLNAFAGGIAAPSANLYNHVSPTLAEHVVSELGDAVDMVLDGGACSVGLESTIVDLTGTQPALLRPGHITPRQLEEVLQCPVRVPQRTTTRAPGMLEIHYAPKTKARLCAAEQLAEEIVQLQKQRKRIGILSHRFGAGAAADVFVLRLPDEADEYGHALYAALRQLDNMKLDIILIEQPPDDDNWLAVNDRLRKATAAGTLIG
ncbi:L-threonylcarbamoyladenylate synthase [Methylomarinum vadi]|uniref:L-threonylcarbamoyladenylate synthase n=1 Tax=Methylomarinum vadi TaxID=438855 RepID=UPI0004DF35C8|nr:L-threonylcarbamoyladenylate synthase [Methylomarinum vadi]